MVQVRSSILYRSSPFGTGALGNISQRELWVVGNPRAGNGGWSRFQAGAQPVLGLLANQGQLGGFKFMATKPDRDQRIDEIASAIVSSGVFPLLTCYGGDGSFGDLCEAHLIAKRRGAPSVVFPGIGGTAGDCGREVGIPSYNGSPANYIVSLFEFLSRAVPARLNLVDVIYGDGQSRKGIQTIAFGFSGRLFAEIAEKRKTQGIGVSTYIYSIAKRLMRLLSRESFFDVTVNGVRFPRTGEFFGSVNTTGIGKGVATVPLIEGAATFHVVPVLSGIAPLCETVLRSFLYNIGYKGVVTGGHLITLGADKIFDLGIGRQLQVKFDPPQYGAVNGDPLEGEIKEIGLVWGREFIDSIALPNARFFDHNPSQRIALEEGRTRKLIG